MIQGAGMEPHALGSHIPGSGNGGGEESAPDTLTDEAWQKAEVGELDSGVGLTLEFEIAGRRA